MDHGVVRTVHFHVTLIFDWKMMAVSPYLIRLLMK